MAPRSIPQSDAGWPDRLDRYYAGEVSAAERAEVEAYLAACPDVAQFFDALRRELAGSGVPSHAPTVALQRIKQAPPSQEASARGAIMAPARPPRPKPRWSTTLGVRPRWDARWVNGFAVGAVLALGVMLGVVSLPQLGVLSRPQRGPVSYMTRPGQRAEVELGDGTRVTLSVASRLDVPDGFGRTGRVVRLTGEAYFRVAHAAGVPFAVDAGRARVAVLGTEFGVRSYDAGDVRVAVKSGKVAVGRAVLLANDVARIAPGEVMTIASHQDLGVALGFVTGTLALRNMPLRMAIPDLNRWYDADVRLGDPALGDKPIEAALAGGSAGDLAEILQVILNVRGVRQGRTLTLYPR